MPDSEGGAGVAARAARAPGSPPGVEAGAADHRLSPPGVGAGASLKARRHAFGVAPCVAEGRNRRHEREQTHRRGGIGLSPARGYLEAAAFKARPPQAHASRRGRVL